MRSVSVDARLHGARRPWRTWCRYLDTARRRSPQRDRSLHEKVDVARGGRRRSSRTATRVGIGGSTLSRTPMAMIWALIRASRKRSHVRARHHLERRRLAVRVGRLRRTSSPSWFSQGIVWGVSKVMRHHVETRHGALRRVEPHGDGHALSRRRDGRAVPADALDARLGRACGSVPKRARWTARSPARSCCSCRRSIRTSR